MTPLQQLIFKAKNEFDVNETYHGYNIHHALNQLNTMEEQTKMTSLKEEAENYESPQTKNIADLESVSVDMEVKEEKDVDFPYRYIEIENVRYRVPVSVLNGLRSILKVQSELKNFRVIKSGEGMKTEYTVVPLK